MNLEEIREQVKKTLEEKQRLSGENCFEYAQKVENYLRTHGIKDETTLKLVYIHHLKKDHKIRKSCQELETLLENYQKFADIKIKTKSLTEFNEKYLIQTCINLVGDVRPLAVRLSEKIINLENSWMFSKEKREDMALRAIYLYSPLAKILGIDSFARELEDTAFKILFPMEFYNLEKAIKKKGRGTGKIFQEIKKFLKQELAEQNILDTKIEFRTKGIYSTYKKLIRYGLKVENLEDSLNKIHDLFALRIIVRTENECYLVESLLQQLWEAVPSARDDYIKDPRPTGYRAVHNAFWVSKDIIMEVQIRTYEMHQKAEFGISSHLLYKLGDKGQKSQAVKEFKKYLATHPEWFKELNFWELQRKSGYIPNTPFSNKEYVLTPKGDIVELPKGSTVIDFAFSVHTEIGEKCVGAFVNNKIVRLNYVVKTGDVISIKTSKRKKTPSRDWLEFVKTRKARNKILKAFALKNN